ncbi:MAG: hypothetical protein F6K04_21020 [Leptolyngbya sp. SIO4C5]|nr:hypothetical protein [Leptolyngbya sp. SIO4C5]
MHQSERRDRNNRNQIIQELRHQLRYTSTPAERDAVRRELDFWIRYR